MNNNNHLSKSSKSKFKYLVEYGQRNNQKLLMENFINKHEMNRYNQRLFEMMSMTDTLNEDSSLNREDFLNKLNNKEFEINNNKEFLDSMKSGNRAEFLTPYTDEDLSKMKTFKVKGYNAGFAIKSDGDIVSVHNNTGINGIGKELIKTAVKNGGNKLDHFDGFLSGFYNSLGFKVVGHDEWNDDYAPAGWKYEPVDPYNPQTSIYAEELKKYKSFDELPDELKSVVNRYKEGKTDIIYRQHV
jgi:hypothetical protein